ncbi:hypothetical protein GL284_03015 [Paracoccus sp. DK608]|uniref:Uncharacterized protein n=1 Tax=Paracoccus shanxieyensis TaxID=2675752 RepID=A0A6L6IUD8_9RHOB|nr:hypothetical protein [Paracoccus shanxieyensis]MTH87152.1 hypothetical protein [Paracoccus shanxieyensis]
MTGILTIGVAIAATVAILGGSSLGLSLWSMLLIYSLGGTAATFFVAWRKFRCMEHAEQG